MFDFDYKKALYRRDNNGTPFVWIAQKADMPGYIKVYYGSVNGKIQYEPIYTNRAVENEIQSMIDAKRKVGYRYLNELKDNCELPVEEELNNYLFKYLPFQRTTADGVILPMLAKAFDNTNNKVFKKCGTYFGQYKINGLRCFITAYEDNDMFHDIHLRFQSREGVYWKGLTDLEEYLLNTLPKEVIDMMIQSGGALDGEIYLPNHTVNEINHFVKDPNCPEHKLLQFWMYDLGIEDMVQIDRFEFINNWFGSFKHYFINKKDHLNNTDRLIVLPTNLLVEDEEDAIKLRDNFIDLGFEGLIMRNPNVTYQFGSRKANVMIKYKRATDGKFEIINIVPEGAKRPDIPLLICKNDINDATFECHLGGTLEYQKTVLILKDKYIGKYVYVEYGERSGISSVPFHIKSVLLIE